MVDVLHDKRQSIADDADAYFGLLDELRTLLGAKVDLVMADAVKNRYIAREIEATKQLLYAA